MRRIIGRTELRIPAEFAEHASAIGDIAKWSGTFIAIRIMAATGAVAKDIQSLADHMQEIFRSTNIAQTAKEAIEIAAEIENNREELIKILESLIAGPAKTQNPQRYEREIGNRV